MQPGGGRRIRTAAGSGEGSAGKGVSQIFSEEVARLQMRQEKKFSRNFYTEQRRWLRALMWRTPWPPPNYTASHETRVPRFISLPSKARGGLQSRNRNATKEKGNQSKE